MVRRQIRVPAAIPLSRAAAAAKTRDWYGILLEHCTLVVQAFCYSLK